MPLQETSGAASFDAFGGGAAAEPVYIEDVFSTYLYAGTGAAQSINNGIGLGNSAANNSSISLNASTPSYLTFSSQVNLSGNFCIQAWVYPTSLTGTRLLFSSTSDNNVQMPRIQENGGIYCFVNGTEITSGATASALQANVWTHLAMTRSGSTFRIFVNGTLYATATYSGTFNIGVLGVFFFNGSLFGTPYAFGGNISNAQIVSGSAIYTANFTPPQNTLSGGAVLLGAGATPLADTSGTGKTVTQFGSPAASASGPWAIGANKGGLVWIKSRSAGFLSNVLTDTVRGNTKIIYSNLTAAQDTTSTSITSFNSNGFSLGTNSNFNEPPETFVSWTFREQPKFFDVVTYSGNGVNGRQISHNLGSTPGTIIVKALNADDNWPVWHRSANGTLRLDSSEGTGSFANVITSASSTTFTVTNNGEINGNGYDYVAYLFAHDAGGFGLSGTDNVITCGSFASTGGGGPSEINLGYEPQWVMLKTINSTGSWTILDNMRGWVGGTTGDSSRLFANVANAESAASLNFRITSTGFTNTSGTTNYIYIAIRRGPMKTPTSGTSVFSPVLLTGNSTNFYDATINPDLTFIKFLSGSQDWWWGDRLRGNGPTLSSNSASAEVTNSGYVSIAGQQNNRVATIFANGNANSTWNFRRAPGFFDEVCYTGTGANRTISHNLAAVPELMIIKRRSLSASWPVYSATVGATRGLLLNSNDRDASEPAYFNSTAPTASVFSVGTAPVVNSSGETYVAYLFATVAGVSRVGSYTGTGATQTINCGFTSGARFVMIKRTNSTGDWYVWDTARGMVSGTDPYLRLNENFSQNNTNSVFTTGVGFQLVTSDVEMNASGSTYIFLAIA